MRLVIFGGRDFYDSIFAYATMNVLHAFRPISCVISGGATGADTLGELWALAHEIPVEKYEARWKDLEVPGAVVRAGRNGRKYNANAGKDRNTLMATVAKPDAGLMFPGGSGTRDMLSQLESRGIEVVKAVDYMNSLGWCGNMLGDGTWPARREQ